MNNNYKDSSALIERQNQLLKIKVQDLQCQISTLKAYYSFLYQAFLAQRSSPLTEQSFICYKKKYQTIVQSTDYIKIKQKSKIFLNQKFDYSSQNKLLKQNQSYQSFSLSAVGEIHMIDQKLKSQMQQFDQNKQKRKIQKIDYKSDRSEQIRSNTQIQIEQQAQTKQNAKQYQLQEHEQQRIQQMGQRIQQMGQRSEYLASYSQFIRLRQIQTQRARNLVASHRNQTSLNLTLQLSAQIKRCAYKDQKQEEFTDKQLLKISQKGSIQNINRKL